MDARKVGDQLQVLDRPLRLHRRMLRAGVELVSVHRLHEPKASASAEAAQARGPDEVLRVVPVCVLLADVVTVGLEALEHEDAVVGRH